MNKDEFMRGVSVITGLSSVDVKKVIAACAAVSVQELAKAGEIRIPGLVTLRAKHYDERHAKNPKTGAPVVVAPVTKIQARPVPALQAALSGK